MLNSNFLKRIAPLCLTAVALLATVPAMAQEVVARIALETDAATLDPRLQRDTTAFRINDVVFSGLVSLDADFQPVPDLALSWEQPDANTWIFHLRDDVTFHDGEKLTAADVAFTFNSILDPALASRYAQFFSAVTSVEAVDDTTVKFNLSAPYAPLLSYLDLGIVPEHYIEAGGDIANAPIGTGPYKLTTWEKGVSMTLDANADYYGGDVYTDQIDVSIVTDMGARAQALEAGDIDILMSNLLPQDINRLASNSAFTHQSLPGVNFEYLNFNTADPILADAGVRRAIAKLVDQQTIIDQILGGIDAPANSIILPSFPWAYSADIAQPKFDIAAATAELDALGWVPGPDGIRAKDGQPLALTFVTNAGTRGQVVEYLQYVFQQAGIDAKIDVTDYASFVAKVYDGTYQIALISVNNVVDPDRVVFMQLHSGSPLNWGKYSNPEYDAAAEAGRTATTTEERAAAYNTAATIAAEDVPYFVLSYIRQDAFTDEAFSFFKADSRGYLRSLVTGPTE